MMKEKSIGYVKKLNKQIAERGESHERPQKNNEARIENGSASRHNPLDDGWCGRYCLCG
jgi:hypothetical protein